MSPRILGAIAAILVLGGGAVAFIWLRAAGEVEGRRDDLLREVTAELSADPLDRESLSRVLRAVDDLAAEEPHAALIRARARVQLSLGRASAAWDTIAPSATDPSGTIEDKWVGALVLRALHAEVGDPAHSAQAASFAVDVHAAEPDVESAFLAWQCTYRVDDVVGWIEACERLQRDHDGTLEARTAADVAHFLALHVADRLGIEGDASALAAIAGDANASDESRALCQFILDSRDAAAKVGEESLRQLDRQWGESPPELVVLLARVEIAKASQPGGAAEEHLNEAIDMLREVLEVFPTYVEARHLIATAHYGLRQSTQQQAHLRWLHTNASAADTRRPAWREKMR